MIHEWREGLTEELIAALTSVATLRVAGRTAPPALKPTHTIEGSLRFIDTHVRVSVRLVDAEMGHTTWSERFECATTGSHVAQEEIAAATTRAVRATNLAIRPTSA